MAAGHEGAHCRCCRWGCRSAQRRSRTRMSSSPPPRVRVLGMHGASEVNNSSASLMRRVISNRHTALPAALTPAGLCYGSIYNVLHSAAPVQTAVATCAKLSTAASRRASLQVFVKPRSQMFSAAQLEGHVAQFAPSPRAPGTHWTSAECSGTVSVPSTNAASLQPVCHLDYCSRSSHMRCSKRTRPDARGNAIACLSQHHRACL